MPARVRTHVTVHISCGLRWCGAHLHAAVPLNLHAQELHTPHGVTWYAWTHGTHGTQRRRGPRELRPAQTCPVPHPTDTLCYLQLALTAPNRNLYRSQNKKTGFRFLQVRRRALQRGHVAQGDRGGAARVLGLQRDPFRCGCGACFQFLSVSLSVSVPFCFCFSFLAPCTFGYGAGGVWLQRHTLGRGRGARPFFGFLSVSILYVSDSSISCQAVVQGQVGALCASFAFPCCLLFMSAWSDLGHAVAVTPLRARI